MQKTNKGEALVKKTERLMFWLERLVGVVSIFLIPKFAPFSNVFFCFSDFIYLICFALRIEVNPLPTVSPNSKNSPWSSTYMHMHTCIVQVKFRIPCRNVCTRKCVLLSDLVREIMLSVCEFESVMIWISKFGREYNFS